MFGILPVCLLSLVFNVKSMERIVGGSEVSILDYPYQLSVRKNGLHICGGALIGSKYGLSAAHCFKYPALYSVKAGSNLKDFEGILTYVKTVLLHPERSTHPFQYDIAILEFQEPFRFSSRIQPVNLPKNSQLIVPGVNGIITGFGDTFASEKKGSTFLRAAEISVENFNDCRNNYFKFGIILTPMVFCAGLLKGGADSCQGDSGGPFVIDNVLYGLVSFGLGCGDSEYPGVYTNVAIFREFIQLNTGI